MEGVGGTVHRRDSSRIVGLPTFVFCKFDCDALLRKGEDGECLRGTGGCRGRALVFI